MLFQHTKDFEDLVRTVVTMLNPEEQDRLREMEDWIIKGEGTWVLAEGFNAFLGRILHDKALPSEARVAMMRLFAYGAEQDDIVLILHMDRKDHSLMNYAQQFDRLPVKEQENLALLVSERVLSAVSGPRIIQSKHSEERVLENVIFSSVTSSRQARPASG